MDKVFFKAFVRAIFISVVPGSVQVPENRTHGQKSIRTGIARKSESVLEPEPEPPKALVQF